MLYILTARRLVNLDYDLGRNLCRLASKGGVKYLLRRRRIL